jgi:GR25 family glycosyltransferase involved in LPS biosynthesis
MGKIHKYRYDYHGICIANLYRAFLQREPDPGGIQSYNSQTYDDIACSIKNSHEYQQICLVKQNTPKLSIDKKLKYTVIKINNRADDYIKSTHEQLKDDFIYCDDLKFIDGKIDDVCEFFNSRGININWVGDLFGHSKKTSSSELACAASHIVAMEYVLNNDIDKLIVFEDDIVLQENAVNILTNCLHDLPNDFDFMSDMTYEPHYEEVSTVEYSILADSKYICKARLQNAHTGCMIYSKQGAQNILNLYKKYGVICAIDTFLFWLNRRSDLKGYTTYYSNRLIKNKDFIGTLIEKNIGHM